jgi:hypothetical protein
MTARDHFGKRFDEVLAYYMLHGYVYIGPDAVILAQTGSYSWWINRNNILDKTDSWYIQYATGNIKRFFEVCPFDLEWVIFERRFEKTRKAYKFSKLKERLNYGSTRPPET